MAKKVDIDIERTRHFGSNGLGDGSSPYLNAYAGEASWRKDNRRVSNGNRALMVIASAMSGARAVIGRGTGNGQLSRIAARNALSHCRCGLAHRTNLDRRRRIARRSYRNGQYPFGGTPSFDRRPCCEDFPCWLRGRQERTRGQRGNARLFQARLCRAA